MWLLGLMIVKIWNPSHPVHVVHHIGTGCAQLMRLMVEKGGAPEVFVQGGIKATVNHMLRATTGESRTTLMQSGGL